MCLLKKYHIGSQIFDISHNLCLFYAAFKPPVFKEVNLTIWPPVVPPSNEPVMLQWIVEKVSGQFWYQRLNKTQNSATCQYKTNTKNKKEVSLPAHSLHPLSPALVPCHIPQSLGNVINYWTNLLILPFLMHLTSRSHLRTHNSTRVIICFTQPFEPLTVYMVLPDDGTVALCCYTASSAPLYSFAMLAAL